MAGNEYVAGLAAPLSPYYESINLPTHYFWSEMKVNDRFSLTSLRCCCGSKSCKGSTPHRLVNISQNFEWSYCLQNVGDLLTTRHGVTYLRFEGLATQKAGYRGGQAVAGNRGGRRSGDARKGAAARAVQCEEKPSSYGYKVISICFRLSYFSLTL